MFYLVIGIVLFVAVGAIITQRSRQLPSSQENGQTDEIETESAPSIGSDKISPEAEADISDSLLLSRTGEPAGIPDEKPAEPPSSSPDPAASGETVPEDVALGPSEEIVPLKPVLAAEPISSPNALTSATYSSAAPSVLSGDSPYAFGNTSAAETKGKPETTLLRWSGKTGSIQIGDLVIRGPVAYWSDGPSSTPEPSCIDITLPVEYPQGEQNPSGDGATSYGEMTPSQRGVYLLWLAGGRIQPPLHVSHPVLWLFGLERRVLSDRLDVTLCIGEAFRLLPLIRWDSLRQGLIKFITWMAAKAWLPEEQLLAFGQSLSAVPTEILCMLLRPYADAKLPLPSIIAFTVMRTSPLAGESQTPVPHSEELLAKFASRYKNKCQGGIVLAKPKTSLFVAYVPTNPTLSGDKNSAGGVLELPDFFKDPADFAPLIAVWKEFLKDLAPAPAPTAAEEILDRPDWDSFVQQLQNSPEGSGEEASLPDGPFVTDLDALAKLMRIERPDDVEKAEESSETAAKKKKPGGGDRKKISDAARIEGFLVLPNLGIAGKEYHWDDPVVLMPIPAGTRLSQDYNAGALMLEYSCALSGTTDPARLENLRKRLDDYLSLSSDDHARLEALSIVLLTHASSPENIGECLQFWLQREQRGVIRDFLLRFLEVSENRDDEKNLTRAICASLDIATSDPPPLLSATQGETAGGPLPPLELGLQTSAVLAPLFKD